MRASELFERAALAYYMHATSAENLESILKKGLIPNHANDGIGNYDDAQWVTLEGIYATNQPQLILNYARAHDISGWYLICLLAVSPNSVLPDEDTINIILRKCYDAVAGWWGIDLTHYEDFEDWAYHAEEVHANSGSDEEFEEPDRDKFWGQVAEEFHKLAKSPTDPRSADTALLQELVDHWSAWAFNAGDSDPDTWKDIKDQVSRRYPRMGHPTLGNGWSIRLPHAVTYAGRNRIVGIVEVIDGYGQVVFGEVPYDARGMIGHICPNIV